MSEARARGELCSRIARCQAQRLVADLQAHRRLDRDGDVPELGSEELDFAGGRAAHDRCAEESELALLVLEGTLSSSLIYPSPGGLVLEGESGNTRLRLRHRNDRWSD